MHSFFALISDSLLDRKHIDSRTRKDRIQRRVDAWQRQIPHLAKQYLKWKEGGAPEESTEAVWKMETISFSGEHCSYWSNGQI